MERIFCVLVIIIFLVSNKLRRVSRTLLYAKGVDFMSNAKKEKKQDLGRRSFLKGTAAAAGLAAVGGVNAFANGQQDVAGSSSGTKKKTKPILIGITSDSSGQYANSGGMDRKGMMLAMKEFNAKGGVLGREVKFIHMDTETTPATGSRVAERMITQYEVNFMMGAVSSGVANAISQVAQRYGCIYLNTNSSSPTESGKNRHRVKFVWDGNGANFSQAMTKNAANTYGKKWLLLTNDYVWGHDTSKATRRLAEAEGVSVMDELLVPQNTRDFSSYLLKIQQMKPDVVATAVGGDDQKVLRQQVLEFKLDRNPAWINNQQDWPDIYGQDVFGIFGTTWYYNMDLPGVKEFVTAYKTEYGDSRIAVPGNVYYNGYMATKALLNAVEKVGSTNNIAVIKELEQYKMSAEGRMQAHDAWMDPETHHIQQTVYMATKKPKEERKDNFDSFKILASVSPENARVKPSEGTLESYADTPTYEL
jgi:branched-chain amino acid transport system substrate-binding protein